MLPVFQVRRQFRVLSLLRSLPGSVTLDGSGGGELPSPQEPVGPNRLESRALPSGEAAFCDLKFGVRAVLKASSESPEAALPQAPLSHGRSSGKGGSVSAWIPPCPPCPSAHLLVSLHERGPGLHDVVADGALAQGCRLVQAGLPAGGTGAGCGPHPVLWALLSPRGPSEGAGSVGSWGGTVGGGWPRGRQMWPGRVLWALTGSTRRG